MDEQTAKNILMGAVSATPEQIAQAHDVIYGPNGTYAAHVAEQAAKLPPINPPYAPPAMLQDSLTQASSDAGVFLSDDYIEQLDFDGYASETINRPNQIAWATYSTLYRKWRGDFINAGMTMPPAPPTYRVGMSPADYSAWWFSGKGNVGLASEPYRLMRARRISSFDFAAALAAKKQNFDKQSQNQPALGVLLAQPA